MYLEHDPKENIEETIEVQENNLSSLWEGEKEIESNEGEWDDLEAPLDDDEIDSYCKKFVDFMQAQLHRKYDLKSSIKKVQRERSEQRKSPPELS